MARGDNSRRGGGEEGVEGSGDGEGVGMEREANDLAAEGLGALKNRYVTR